VRPVVASRWLRAVAAGAVFASVPPLFAGDDGPSSKAIEQLNRSLLIVLKDAASLGYRGRFDRLTPIMTQAFDLDFMAQKALGRHWQRLSEADRTRWLAVFREFTIANYAANFDHFSNQRFDTFGEEPSAGDTTLVKTRVNDPIGESVDLTYRLHQVDGTWRIVDVYLKGTVSELALRRSDYTAVLEHDGFDALVTTVRGKIGDLAAGRAKRPGSGS
jgi:phospholipid transport system substrate-binding protein